MALTFMKFLMTVNVNARGLGPPCKQKGKKSARMTQLVAELEAALSFPDAQAAVVSPNDPKMPVWGEVICPPITLSPRHDFFP